MNIFFLSQYPDLAAQMMCDKHIVKMILELCQMLWAAFHITGEEYWMERVPKDIKIYRKTHANHPMSQWIRHSPYNFIWAAQHAVAIGNEYTKRYGKIHSCQKMAEWFCENMPLCNDEYTKGNTAVFCKTDLPMFHNTNEQLCTPPPITITNKEYHRNSLIDSYRTYYIQDKVRFAKWKNGSVPVWFSS